MQFKYRNKSYNFPTTLSDISLQQRIDFDRMYGVEILEEQKKVYQTDDNGNALPVDETEELFLNVSVAIKNFSFFTGIPIEEVENSIPIETVLNIYYSCFKILYEQQEKIEFQENYLWNGELWFIEKPQLTYQSTITFNELIVSKQIVKQMHDLSAGNWEALPYLATIFLKKENEIFDEKWLEPDSERVKLMSNLPMDIAMAVGFFLAISISLFQKTSQSLEEAEVEEKD